MKPRLGDNDADGALLLGNTSAMNLGGLPGDIGGGALHLGFGRRLKKRTLSQSSLVSIQGSGGVSGGGSPNRGGRAPATQER